MIQPKILAEIGNSSTPKLLTRFYVKIALAEHHNHQTDRFGAVKVMSDDVKAKIEDLVLIGITKPHDIQLLLNEFVEAKFPEPNLRPPYTDRSLYPMKGDIRNQVYKSTLKHRFFSIFLLLYYTTFISHIAHNNIQPNQS